MKHAHSQFASANAARAAYAGDVSDRVRRFMPLVRKLAWHVHGAGRAGIEVEDLMQAGLVALTEAAQRHDGPTEDGFAAYAKLRVRGAMIDLVRRNAPLSRGALERRKRVEARAQALRGMLGRDPSEAELAEDMGLSADELAELRATSEPLRFEAIDEVYSDHDPAFADDGDNGFDALGEAELHGQLTEAIAALPERLRLITQLYFVEELNLSEIAEVLSVSVPRVHQLKAQALEKLRAHMEECGAELL
ncbi:MAG: sigma-70 family RNA polymerase sigma factor [Sphingomonadaceae bacterium]|jgi:RNA polymerase sigma factor for flagellar operon FliA